mmetsp:Transcript_9249/g.18466  ORF Transcript_9249/g.18466 Transcript_9249/m.18466 type:complete len:129 (+) Transcript_9249:120-506(+)
MKRWHANSRDIWLTGLLVVSIIAPDSVQCFIPWFTQRASAAPRMMPRECTPETNYNFLQAIIEKAEGDPRLLILSAGDRPGGALPPRRVQSWAETHGFDYEFHCTNPNDEAHKTTTSTVREALASFIA